MSRAPTLQIDVHLGPQDMARALHTDARRGLSSTPKELPPKWFYDDHGSRLFDEITRLPEYYLTRCEREILDDRAGEIARRTRADTLVELGSGTSEKTRLLLAALCEEGCLRRFVPFDVSETVLREAARDIDAEFPHVLVHAVVADFERHLSHLPDAGRRLVAFLGSTIGNFPPTQRARFLGDLAGTTHPGDFLLVGFDLVKDVSRLEAAYDDARGITADFNRNVLRVLNRELGATFEPDRFEHVARFDTAHEWVEMLLRSDGDQVVRVAALGLDVAFGRGEEMRTEISAKFRRERVEAELGVAGFESEAWWTDAAGDFALSLWRRA